MKSILYLLTALSLIAPCALAATPGGAEDGAKGLFRQQLEHPDVKINTGISYWIELRRDGQVMRANNKTEFKAGDQIAFHVTANINGYAYILLRSGSQGEQAILFPNQDKGETNRVKAGEEMSLPTDGVMTFDKNPGVEKITLLVSRMPINASAYLRNSSDSHVAPQLVAMADSGSKDLVPAGVQVSYAAWSGTTRPVDSTSLINNDVDPGPRDYTYAKQKVSTNGLFDGGSATTEKVSKPPAKAASAASSSRPPIIASTAKHSTAVIASKVTHPVLHKHPAKAVNAIAAVSPHSRPRPARESSPAATEQILVASNLSTPSLISNDSGARTERDFSTSGDIAGGPRDVKVGADSDDVRPLPAGYDSLQSSSTGQVTIVSGNPDGVLAAELTLKHVQ